MEKHGFFDLIDREALLEKLGDPLPKIGAIVDWEGLRREPERVPEKPRKSKAGRKPFDVVLRFEVLVLEQMYDLGDDQFEYQVRDRYSFYRLLGLTPEGRVPDAKAIWLFRERLVQRALIEPLFAAFFRQIERAGCQARKGAPRFVPRSSISSAGRRPRVASW